LEYNVSNEANKSSRLKIAALERKHKKGKIPKVYMFWSAVKSQIDIACCDTSGRVVSTLHTNPKQNYLLGGHLKTVDDIAIGYMDVVKQKPDDPDTGEFVMDTDMHVIDTFRCIGMPAKSFMKRCGKKLSVSKEMRKMALGG
jgi:hypothetical protein